MKSVVNYKDPTIQSLCWTCQHAWPGKCQWVTSQKRVWQKAQKKELSGTRGKGYIVYVVQECEFYAPEEELEEEKKGKGERKTAKWHEREDALCADRRSP